MKLTVTELKKLIRESLEEMGMGHEEKDEHQLLQDRIKELKATNPEAYDKVVSLFDEADLEGEGVHLSVEQQNAIIDSVLSEMEQHEEDLAWGQEMADKHHEFEQSTVPEEGEEFVGHEGMGRRHLHETIKLMVSEILEEAKKAKKYKGKSMRKGGGGRFAKLVDKLKASGKSEESAKAIAASAGRAKYGAKEMAKMAKAGKKRAAKKK